MKSYLVNIRSIDFGGGAGLWLNGELRAKSWDEAEKIAEREGYELVGPLLDNKDVEEIEAMIDARDATLN